MGLMDDASRLAMPADASAATGAVQGTGAHGVWPEAPAGFSTRRVNRLRHDFHRHPLFQLPALQALAQKLSATGQCRFIHPGSTQGSAFSHEPTHPLGWSMAEVFARMEEPASWLALYNVETDPAYRDLLEGMVADLRPLIEPEQGAIYKVTGFMFLSAPPAVTPFHIDRENNFWLQLHGRKTLNVWQPGDDAVVAPAAVEEFIASGNLAGVKLREGARARSLQWDVGPGEGVFFPSTSPHMTCTEDGWTRPGDGVAVSIGVNFYTDLTLHTARVYQFNRVARMLGMSPAPPGASAQRDAIKAPLGSVLARLRYRRRRPPFSC